MLSNSFSIEEKSIVEADICIVGAGCAGITLATELNHSTLKVILLESGSLEYDDKTQSLYEGENISINPFKLENTRLRYFGGSTNHWGGMCHPLDETDFLAREDIPYPGWPIRLNDLIPYYHRAQSICQLGPFVYDDENYWRQQINFSPLPISGNLLETAFFQYSPPTRFGEVYLEALKKSTNVDVILNANVLELETSNDANNITQVRVANLNGKIFFVKAKKFVLSAGGLETPRLLLLSNKVQKNGLGNQYDLLGRYYMDHLSAWGGSLQFITDQSNFPWYFKIRNIVKNLGNMEVGALLTPTADLMKKEGLTNFRILLLPTEEERGIDSAKLITHELTSGHIPDNFGGHLKNVLSELDSVANVAYKSLFHTNNDLFEIHKKNDSTAITKVNLDLNLEQLPNRESRVSLSTDRDIFDQNRIKLDWRTSEADNKTARRALEIFAMECGKYNLGRVYIPDTINEQNIAFGISSHHMGATRMASSASEGVVDENCRVHGIGNLFIASSSVFPTAGWANPTLTITALSVRLADHLKSIFS
ncbi:MAG: GMC family oxidoreductase [Methylococcales bacterium]|nr:GMC family oxidoreductase [Methylococcales bacterium]